MISSNPVPFTNTALAPFIKNIIPDSKPREYSWCHQKPKGAILKNRQLEIKTICTTTRFNSTVLSANPTDPRPSPGMAV